MSLSGERRQRRELGPPDEPRWPDVLTGVAVAIGALAVLAAVHWMDWASHSDGVHRTIVDDGPTPLLVVATLVSLLLALLGAVTRRHALRLLQLAATLVTAGAAIAVALSRIATANEFGGTGHSMTSYEPGAAVGVIGSLVMAAASTLGACRGAIARRATRSGGSGQPIRGA